MNNAQIQEVAPLVGEPTLADLLNVSKKDIFGTMNCHHVGIIQSFDPTNQTAVVSIAYLKTVFVPNPKTGVSSPQTIQYPLIAQCPVIVLGGNLASITFPITQGDECLLLFNDRDLDNWFQSGQVTAAATNRMHSFADAIALVGIRSLNSILEDYDAVNAVFQNGSSGVKVAPEGVITIYNESTTLNTVLQQILIQLKALANTECVPSSPLNPAVATELATLATTLGGLIG